MRILFLVSWIEESVVDRLIAGLVRCNYTMGHDLVVYPPKPSLHCDADEFFCLGLPLPKMPIQSVDTIKAMLRNKSFDVVFLGAITAFPSLYPLYDEIFDAMGDIPCVHFWEHPAAVERVWPFRALNVVCRFVRNKLPDREGYPISYSVLGEEMAFNDNRSSELFFSGDARPHRERSSCVDALKRAGYDNLFLADGHTFAYRDYLIKLRDSCVTFLFSSTNNNMNRRFEGAANGVLTFIRRNVENAVVRSDFSDKENAIFYTGEHDLIELLEGVLKDKEYLWALMRAGHKHVLENHLVQHTAKYVLDIAGRCLGGG